jgi:oligogalacturonide lyase
MQSRFFVVAILFAAIASSAHAIDEPPTDWIDPDTGHRVVRLSREPESLSLYFHQYPFSADGSKMVITTPQGLSSVELDTRKIETLVTDPVLVLVTGRKTGDVYYILDGAVHAVSFETRESRKVADLPVQYKWPEELERRSRAEPRPTTKGDPAAARIVDERNREARRRNRGWGNVTVNADETLLVGIGYDPAGKIVPRKAPAGEPDSGRLGPAWESGVPRVMFTIDTKTGETKVIHRSNDWLNHLQCSPTDPGQVLFCHEGPWHYVDRTWFIRTDGTGLTQVHPRTIDMEIGGHEFFSQDGRTVWYDLQTPRSMVFWLSGYEIATGKRTWYHLERNEWSVHYNISPDGKLFSGDGGGPSSVANLSPSFGELEPPGNGQWMYLFTPHLNQRTGLPEQAAKQVKTGELKAERLVSLANHDYNLEPNGIFTPDGKWLVFRSNMHGAGHVYMVELAKSEGED